MRPALIAAILLPAALLGTRVALAACDRIGVQKCRADCHLSQNGALGAVAAQFEACNNGCLPGSEGKRCRLACREAWTASVESTKDSGEICLDTCPAGFGCKEAAGAVAARVKSGAAGEGAGDGTAIPVPRPADTSCTADTSYACGTECVTVRETNDALFLEEYLSCMNGCEEGNAGRDCRVGCRGPLLAESAGAARTFEGCRKTCEQTGGCESQMLARTIAAVSFGVRAPSQNGDWVRRGVGTRAPRAVAASIEGRSTGAAMRR